MPPPKLKNLSHTTGFRPNNPASPPFARPQQEFAGHNLQRGSCGPQPAERSDPQHEVTDEAAIAGAPFDSAAKGMTNVSLSSSR